LASQAHLEAIKERTRALLLEIPPHVQVVAAAKTRSPEEIKAAVEAGVQIVGHNYVKEAEAQRHLLGGAQLHLIGHLQTNKAKKAIGLFHMIQTLDSRKLAMELQRHCTRANCTMDVLIEVNSAREPQKSGVMPEELEDFLKEIQALDRILVKGLMTMGPLLDDMEQIRPFFRLTKELFDRIRTKNYLNVEMKILSMGMSDSYRIAIEEGANMVRIGTKIFGPRII
jgi:pyridoxal phosphate enzyme (YggS family)